MKMTYVRSLKHFTMEHPGNKIITYFENELRPVLLQSNVQQMYNLHKFHTGFHT